MLDDGQLTDGQGRTVDERRAKVMDVVNLSFKPEFLNRLDDGVVFDVLSTKELSRIVDLQIAAMRKRLVEKRITLTAVR